MSVISFVLFWVYAFALMALFVAFPYVWNIAGIILAIKRLHVYGWFNLGKEINGKVVRFEKKMLIGMFQGILIIALFVLASILEYRDSHRECSFLGCDNIVESGSDYCSNHGFHF